MTTNQLRFQELQETKKRNAMQHQIDSEKNAITRDANAKQHSFNLMNLAETSRHNSETEMAAKAANANQSYAVREQHRANIAKEEELVRSNKAREAENYRSNVARESENTRHNRATERHTTRQFKANEQQRSIENLMRAVDWGIDIADMLIPGE